MNQQLRKKYKVAAAAQAPADMAIDRSEPQMPDEPGVSRPAKRVKEDRSMG